MFCHENSRHQRSFQPRRRPGTSPGFVEPLFARKHAFGIGSVLPKEVSVDCAMKCQFFSDYSVAVLPTLSTWFSVTSANVWIVCVTNNILLSARRSSQRFSSVTSDHLRGMQTYNLCCRCSMSLWLSVCVCLLDSNRELCYNGSSNRDAVPVADSGGPRESCIGWGPCLRRGNIQGISGPTIK